MNALVGRGAPRDLLDVFEVCRRQLATTSECWGLWSRKNPGRRPEQARLLVLHHVAALELRRPLERIENDQAREAARAVRRWARGSLCGDAG